jgi:hypothetical protein
MAYSSNADDDSDPGKTSKKKCGSESAAPLLIFSVLPEKVT